jgi:calcineurin-like phosphoesterase family protein
MRYITADWHLGEDRFKIMQRIGFLDAQHMVDQLVKWHNEIVRPSDEVIMVGDAVYQNSPEFIHQIARFNGRKMLIRGNHDRAFTNGQLSPYFDEIIPEGEGLYIDGLINGVRCYATHYPTRGKMDAFNLVGHIHSAWKVQLNMLNVGVDVNHFRPMSLDKDVPFLFGAIKEFYDDDVWVAYQDVNANHTERGKSGCYFVDGKP